MNSEEDCMNDQKSHFTFTRGKLIFDYSALFCDTPEKLLKSELFMDIIERFLLKLKLKESPLYEALYKKIPEGKREDISKYIVNLLRLLYSHKAKEIVEMECDYETILKDNQCLYEIIEELYNYWIRLERFFYLKSTNRSDPTKKGIHHAKFIELHVEFKNLILKIYRQARENLTSKNPRIFRQLPAGINMGMLIEERDWKCPDVLLSAKDIPFIRLAVMEAPLIIYPKRNTRKGMFEEIHELNKDMLLLVREDWFCLPAKIGDLTAFIYFHRDFISQGLSLCNLFEIANYDDIEGKRPDMTLFFGLKNENFPGDTVFFDDGDSGMLVGLLKYSEDIDYFGYFKKMPLTLHNIAMLRRGRLPVHGAMSYINVKGGGTAGIVIIGDSGAGKSETLEAIRALAEERIRDMKIIFDDMGSIGISKEKKQSKSERNEKLVGYGTEIGAFVRLDDLQPGYAYEEINRSIFMNPDKINARLIIPLTTYETITKGHDIDIVLYANNFEQVDDTHPILEFFNTPEEALRIFKEGARKAKGTTDEKGIVQTYFANPFGAPQRKDIHEKHAEFYFNKMFELGIKVGQIRTRLAIDGFEFKGPNAAAEGLFNVIRTMP